MHAIMSETAAAQAVWSMELTNAPAFVVRMIVIVTKASCEAQARTVIVQNAQALPENRKALETMIFVDDKS